jgi:hypothetical protein
VKYGGDCRRHFYSRDYSRDRKRLSHGLGILSENYRKRASETQSRFRRVFGNIAKCRAQKPVGSVERGDNFESLEAGKPAASPGALRDILGSRLERSGQ